jgi:hypothetical protein
VRVERRTINPKSLDAREMKEIFCFGLILFFLGVLGGERFVFA